MCLRSHVQASHILYGHRRSDEIMFVYVGLGCAMLGHVPHLPNIK
jgi:hypothetical protein